MCEFSLKDKEIIEYKNYDSYKSRLEDELKILNDLGFVDYILLNWDVINFCKEKEIPTGPGRGSAAGSLVLYLIGVTKVDPVKHDPFLRKICFKK